MAGDAGHEGPQGSRNLNRDQAALEALDGGQAQLLACIDSEHQQGSQLTIAFKNSDSILASGQAATNCAAAWAAPASTRTDYYFLVQGRLRSRRAGRPRQRLPSTGA